MEPYYEEEEKYMVFDKILGDSFPDHESMRGLCLDYKGRWSNLEREIRSSVPQELNGFLLLKRAGLGETQLRDVILAMNGDWKLKSRE